MCVAAIAWNAYPDWHLVAIGNRDEFHERPAAPLAQWDGPGDIIAGRDLQSGGTWLGVSEQGQFVLVTNLRGYGTPDPARKSRGELVSRLLAGEEAPQTLEVYNPFNLLHVTPAQANFLTNRPEDTHAHLASGIYGLSNGTLDEPWAKTLQLKSSLQSWLAEEGDQFDPLFATLTSEELPDMGTHPLSPSDIAIEPSETPPFIRHQLYGTRCSTVVAIDRTGHGRIVEQRFDAGGQKTGETALEFRWAG